MKDPDLAKAALAEAIRVYMGCGMSPKEITHAADVFYEFLTSSHVTEPAKKAA